MGIGPIILGYKNTSINNAIKKQLNKGIIFSLVNPLEIKLAQELNKLIPNLEMFRFSKTGADITSAMLALDVFKKSNKKIIPIFKDFYADYLKRAEGDVHFVCTEGFKIRKMVQDTIDSNSRINGKICVDAFVPDKFGSDPVAKFTLTLSLKSY